MNLKTVVHRLGGRRPYRHARRTVYFSLLESVPQRQQRYVGLPRDLRQTLRDHNAGKSPHTPKFKPWALVAHIGFADEPTTAAFEQYLKSGSGKTFLNRHCLRTPAPTNSLAL